MATTIKAQCWGYTLNNHTTQELVLIRDPPPSVGIQHHVWTPEEGAENGTPHIQGYVKLTTQVRKSHLIKRWLERASYRALNADEYNAAMLAYVQKQDETARGPTTQTTHTPRPVMYPAMVPELIVKWVVDNTTQHFDDHQYPRDNAHWRRWIRDDRHQGEEFAQWLDRQTDKTDRYVWRHHSTEIRTDAAGEVMEIAHVWCGREFMPTHEAPWLLMVEFAKSQLVRTHQCETLMMRPDVNAAVRRYTQEILWRIEHSHADPTPVSQESDDEAEAESPAPPSDSAPPAG